MATPAARLLWRAVLLRAAALCVCALGDEDSRVYRAPPLALGIEQFADLLPAPPTLSEATYSVLSQQPKAARNAVLATVTERVLLRADDDNHTKLALKAPSCAGEHAWRLHNGSRLLVKFAHFGWDASAHRWLGMFCKVVEREPPSAPLPFDILVLGLLSPRGLYLYRHDLEYAMVRHATKKRLTADVRLSGPVGGERWWFALDHMLDQLDATNCQRLAHLPFTDERFEASLGTQPSVAPFVRSPFAALSAAERDEALVEITRRVAAMWYPEATFAELPAESQKKSDNETADTREDKSVTDGTPTDETPTDETPTDETPTDETPTDESATYNETVNHAPAKHAPYSAANATGQRPSAGRHTFLRDGIRVTVRTAALAWLAKQQRWLAQWLDVRFDEAQLAQLAQLAQALLAQKAAPRSSARPAVQPPQADDGDASLAQPPSARLGELLLTLLTPMGLFVYRHDLHVGVSPQGKRTRAHREEKGPFQVTDQAPPPIRDDPLSPPVTPRPVFPYISGFWSSLPGDHTGR
jgi:hypothetical protein